MSSMITASQLSATDRCDRCGAQAYARATLPSGSELLFCAHHWNENADRLRELAVDILDETHRLGSTPAIAPDGER